MIPTEAVAQVSRDEGFEPLPYRDSLGFLTIGHGFLIDPKKAGSGITREESELILRCRLEKLAYEILPKRAPWFLKLDEVRRMALVNMAYNLGVDGLLKFKRMIAFLKIAAWSDAAAQALDSKWAKQVGKRADRLAEQLRTGEWQ